MRSSRFSERVVLLAVPVVANAVVVPLVAQPQLLSEV
jgi:hypothetical protein